jgi:uncharacterized protein (DUF2345 family)
MPAGPVVPDDKRDPDRLVVQLVDRSGAPIKDAQYVLTRPDGTVEKGKTDGSGKVEIKKTVTGIGHLEFPDYGKGSIHVKD